MGRGFTKVLTGFIYKITRISKNPTFLNYTGLMSLTIESGTKSYYMLNCNFDQSFINETLQKMWYKFTMPESFSIHFFRLFCHNLRNDRRPIVCYFYPNDEMYFESIFLDIWSIGDIGSCEVQHVDPNSLQRAWTKSFFPEPFEPT